MKRNLLAVGIAAVFLLYFACRKTDNIASLNTTDPFVHSAIQWAKQNMPTNDFEDLDLTSIHTLTDQHGTIALEVFTKDKSTRGHVIIGKDTNSNFAGNWVNWEHSGPSLANCILRTESFDGNSTKVVTVVTGKARKISNTVSGVTQDIIINYPKANSIGSTDKTSGKQIGTAGTMTTEGPPTGGGGNGTGGVDLPSVTVVAYINNSNSGYFDYSSIYWALNQNPSYLTTYSYPTNYGAGGGNTSSSTTNLSLELRNYPNIPIADLLKCFDNVPSTGATYSIKILVDIPQNGNPNAVCDITGSPGHTFIELTKTNGSQSITQDIGFYPQNGFKSLTNNPVPSKIVDNGYDYHEYNASLTIPNVTGSQFNVVMGKLTQLASNQYQILGFNCTAYVLNAVNSIRSTPIQCVPLSVIIGGYNVGTSIYTPQGLYMALQNTPSTSPDYANTQTNIVAKATSGHGACP